MERRQAKRAFTSLPLPNGIRVEIPTARNWFVLVFLPFWLCGWAAGEAALIRSLLVTVPEGGGRDPLLGFWLAGWTLGGLFGWLVFFWFLVGVETIEVSSRAMTISRKVGPFVRRKTFDPARIRNLRIVPLEPEGDSPLIGFAVKGTGIIAFDFGSGTHRFGALSDPAEAQRVCREIAEWLPPASSTVSGGEASGRERA